MLASLSKDGDHLTQLGELALRYSLSNDSKTKNAGLDEIIAQIFLVAGAGVDQLDKLWPCLLLNLVEEGIAAMFHAITEHANAIDSFVLFRVLVQKFDSI